MSAIHLSGAQVTRIQECLTRYREDTHVGMWRDDPDVPVHIAIETLVEDILKIVLPQAEVSVGSGL